MACAPQQYIPEPIDTKQIHRSVQAKQQNSHAFRNFLMLNGYPLENWPITQWNLHSLFLAAVYFNPELQVAWAAVEISTAKAIIAAQRTNPNITIPFEHHSDNSGPPWLIGIVGDFLFENSDKYETRKKQAALKTEVVRINFEAQVWNIYSQLHQALIEYYAANALQKNLLQQVKLLQKKLESLTKLLEFGQVSQFELSSTRLELQQVKLNLSEQNYQINDLYHHLIAITGLPVSRFNNQGIEPADFDAIDLFELPDKKILYETILQQRFDVRIKLKEYEVFEQALKLEILRQYPDLNLSPGFIFEQGDNIWALGASWVLPLFHNNNGQIQQAFSRRSKLQTEFISLQTTLINEVDRKYQNYLDKVDTYQTMTALADALSQRAVEIHKQYELGYTDNLNVLRTQLEIEKARSAILTNRIDILRVMEQIENLSQNPLNSNIRFNEVVNNFLQDKTR